MRRVKIFELAAKIGLSDGIFKQQAAAPKKMPVVAVAGKKCL